MILNEIIKERSKDYFCFGVIFKLVDLSFELIKICKYLKAEKNRETAEFRESAYKILNEKVNLLMTIAGKIRPLARTFELSFMDLQALVHIFLGEKFILYSNKNADEIIETIENTIGQKLSDGYSKFIKALEVKIYGRDRKTRYLYISKKEMKDEDISELLSKMEKEDIIAALNQLSEAEKRYNKLKREGKI